jgi:flagellar motor switch protein FliN
MTAHDPAFSSRLARFGDVAVNLSVELGRTDLPLRDVLALNEGSVVTLNRLTDELLDVTANGRVIARGEVVAQNGRFALRIVSLVGEEGASASRGEPDADPAAPSFDPGAAMAGDAADIEGAGPA